MIITKNILDPEIIKSIEDGGIGVIPTDTLYGIVGSAYSESTVSRIYAAKERNLLKPFIVLISDLEYLDTFGIVIDKETQNILKKVWPGPVSVILRGVSSEYDYLSRERDSLALRWPKDERVVSLIKEVGPLVAPSANKEGKPPAKNIAEAKSYFGELCDFYVDGGEIESEPSSLIEIVDGEVKLIRGDLDKI